MEPKAQASVYFFNSIYPGASFDFINSCLFWCNIVKSLNKNYFLFVGGGTSCISAIKSTRIVDMVCSLIDKLFKYFKHTNLILSTILYRHHFYENSVLNRSIRLINNYNIGTFWGNSFTFIDIPFFIGFIMIIMFLYKLLREKASYGGFVVNN